MLIELKLLFYGFLLPQVPLDFRFEFKVYFILLSHSFKNSNFGNILILRGPNCRNDSTNLRDIVCKNYATKEFQEGNNKTLTIGYRKKISKTYSHHGRCCPVITPHVLNVPNFMINMLSYHPVFVFVDFGHCKKHRSNKMSKNEVKNDDLEQLIILVFSETVDESGSEQR